jgi:hypothetical protein
MPKPAPKVDGKAAAFGIVEFAIVGSDRRGAIQANQIVSVYEWQKDEKPCLFIETTRETGEATFATAMSYDVFIARWKKALKA